MSHLVGNPEDRFSHDAAHLFQYDMAQPTQTGSRQSHSAAQHTQLAQTGLSLQGDVDVRHTEVLQVMRLRSLNFLP